VEEALLPATNYYLQTTNYMAGMCKTLECFWDEIPDEKKPFFSKKGLIKRNKRGIFVVITLLRG
jgi:hypothetical protein